MGNDRERIFPLKEEGSSNRDAYRRDYERALHSPAFRRLENKTQLFPGHESDFFRNRLTHSLEVAQIAKGIAEKLRIENNIDFIESDVCETAGLLHDVGHPPFGHNGELALDTCMRKYGGFEGNAQTLHIVTRLEKKDDAPAAEETSYENLLKDGKDNRYGLNLTYRTLGSLLKYDHEIYPSRSADDALQKGYYECDKSIVKEIKKALIGSECSTPFKTVECQIMDIADDIAYSTYDLEDAFKAGFLTPFSMMAASDEIYEEIACKLNKMKLSVGSNLTAKSCRDEIIDIFGFVWSDAKPNEQNTDYFALEDKALSIMDALHSYDYSQRVASDGFLRTKFTSNLVKYFISGVLLEKNEKHPVLSRIEVNPEVEMRINLLKHFTYRFIISSSRLKVVENRGFEIVTKVFERLASDDGYKYLPEDYQAIYHLNPSESFQKRLICDFIAGMTDRYAVEFYGRLFSENPQTIFKPL